MPPAEIRVTLPDGSEKRLPVGSTGADLAKAIGPGLAKAALAVRVDGQVRDLARPPRGPGDRAGDDPHGQGPAGARRAAPLQRPRARHCRAPAVPPREDRL